MLRSPKKQRTIPRRMSRGTKREYGRSRSSTKTSMTNESSQSSKTEDEPPEVEMNDVTTKLSSLSIIPRSVKFGGKATLGFPREDTINQ